MKLLKKHSLMIVALIIAAVLRFYQLGSVPPSPNWDEAALGYNAYSILKTGKDEYGTPFPLTLRSYDDYKPPLYMYATVPSVAVFGLNTWAVRFPSAVAGLVAVIGIYTLVSELMTPSQKKDRALRMLPGIAALLMAVSPWNIQFSRIAFEANLALTITILAVVAFLKGRKSTVWFSVSAMLFALTLYAYHSQRIFTPLLVLILVFTYRKQVFANRRRVIVAVIAGLLTVAPLIRVFADPTTLTRLRGTSSLADQTRLLETSVEKLIIDRQQGNVIGELLDNRRLVWARTVADGYLSHFSLRWLFLTGDNPRHHAPDHGLLYVFELPLLFLGLYAIATKKRVPAALIFGWLAVAPVAASPTTELPHGIRSYVMLPALVIGVAVGITHGIEIWHRYRPVYRRTSAALVAAIIVFFFSHFLSLYFGFTNTAYSRFWQYGYKQAVGYAQEHADEYEKVIVSIKLEQPHMFFLFYTKYSPEKYLAEGGTSSGGFAEVRNRFGMYEFRDIDWAQEEKNGKYLYIASPKEIPPEEGIEVISYLDGSPAMVIAR